MTRNYRWLLIGNEHPADPHLGPDGAAPPLDADEIHLFVRGYESIRILIRTTSKTVQVFGPGRVQKLQEFSSPTDLQRFLESYQKDVLAAGWTLLDVNDRRIANRS
jgi:hypothetical protein